MGRARVEGHIAIYESVKVILVVGVALSLSFSSPLPLLASHSFVARRSSRPLSSSPSSRSLPPPPLLLLRTLLLRTSLVARRGRRRRRRRRRPRRVRGIASRSRAASLALIIDNIDSVCAHHHHYIDSACAQDCFALPSSFANKTKGPAFFVFKISRTLRYLGGKTREDTHTENERGLVEGKSKKILLI